MSLQIQFFHIYKAIMILFASTNFIVLKAEYTGCGGKQKSVTLDMVQTYVKPCIYQTLSYCGHRNLFMRFD